MVKPLPSKQMMTVRFCLLAPSTMLDYCNIAKQCMVVEIGLALSCLGPPNYLSTKCRKGLRARDSEYC